MTISIKWNKFDYIRYSEIYNDPKSIKYMGFRYTPEEMTPEHLIKWYNEKAADASVIAYGIWDDNQFVGAIRLQYIDYRDGRADKHTMIDPAQTGRGIATLATKLLLSKHPFRVITSSVMEPNKAMRRVNAKCGFNFEFMRKKFYLFEGGYVGQCLYSLHS